MSARCTPLVCRPASVVREYKAGACQARALLLIRLRMASRLQFVLSASAVVQNTCIVNSSCVHECVFRSLAPMLAKWFAPARLETRTKESNMCASIVVPNHGA